MALTEIKTSGIADDAITTDKLANAINTERTANTAKPSLANDANNRVVTGDGSGGLNGEANLTYDGTDLKITTDTNGEGIVMYSSGSTFSKLSGDANRASENQSCLNIQANWDGTPIAAIDFVAGADTTNKDDGKIRFQTTTSGSNIAERMRIESDGNVKILDGDLVVGTAGHGIDFSAQTATGNQTNELLDHYEVGAWTPAISFGGETTGITYATTGTNQTTGRYIRIGKQVTITAHIKLTSKGSSTGNARITGLPWNNASTVDGGRASGQIGYIENFSTGSPLLILVENNNNYISFRRLSSGWDGSENVSNADFTNSSRFFFSLTYFA